MRRLEHLKPSETDLAFAYAELVQQHEPRTVKVGFTGTNACTVCDEIWPCHVATLLAGFREFRQEAKRLADATIDLTQVAQSAAELIKGLTSAKLSAEQHLELSDRLTTALENMKTLKE